MELISQIIGWVGTACVLIAYLSLVYYEKITEESRSYQILNLLGAIFIAVSVFYKTAWPAFALQIAWGLIAVFSLVRKKK